MGFSYFFGIGISKYDQFSHLNNGAKDVLDVAELLSTNFQFSKDNMKLLLDAEATRENIFDQLDFYKKQITSADELVIYFSGHGTLDVGKNQRGFWIPYDAKRNSVGTYLNNSSVKDYLADIDSFHTLVLADACYAGSLMTKTRTPKLSTVQFEKGFLTKLNEKKSRLILCSGRHDEEVVDGQNEENSPFASAFIQALHNSQDPGINFTELYNEVKKLVGYNNHQVPEGGPAFQSGHEGGEFVFWRKGNRLPSFPEKDLPGSRPKQYEKTRPDWGIIASTLAFVFAAIFTLYLAGVFSPVIESEKNNQPDLSAIQEDDLTEPKNDGTLKTDEAGEPKKPETSPSNPTVEKENRPEIELEKTYRQVTITHNYFDTTPSFFIENEPLTIVSKTFNTTVLLLPSGSFNLVLKAGSTECSTPITILETTKSINFSCP